MDDTPNWSCMHAEYLGDGLYARYDGYSFWLSAERSSGEHYVALEPAVLDSFNAWVKRMREPVAEHSEPLSHESAPE